MERRIDKIYDFVQKRHQENPKNSGVSTAEVADTLDIQRTNASKDLNRLVRDGFLGKTDGRPVRYFPLSEATETSKTTDTVDTPSIKETSFLDEDIFTRIIGASGSMRNAVEQAKAAILYPPRGLNCLITGPTGSGKTFFAQAMFQFAKRHQVIEENRELVVFNCADYAHNPELLMSHLFGYSKGAFTGADTDKSGLVQEADGSMLFLDEIHRLPPEGQEMIFYFMDHGTYNRMGETGKTRRADVRIVGATTEDPRSALLETFVRRIPINIQMPAFNERPVIEQIDLVRIMVAIEANRIQRRIILSEDVVKALLGSVTYGNIGQLKSNVQLVCARGFMNHMDQEEITISVGDLTEGVKSGLAQLATDRVKTAEISRVLVSKMVISPNEVGSLNVADSYELPYNLYDIIGDKAALLKDEGLDQEMINHFISTDINVHLKSFYKDHGFSFGSESRLSEFVDDKIIDLSHEIYKLAERRLPYVFQQNFIYAMSLHISSFLKQLNLGRARTMNDNIREMARDYQQEFIVAKEIRGLIEESLRVRIPENEEYYLTVLLVSLRADQALGRIGVVLAAHGTSTASSMTQVVRELLNVNNITAVDMPLDMHPRIAYEKLREAVIKMDEGSGVLLLVDMGSLVSFNDEIQQETGIPVRTIDMVTTPLAMEAVRKSSVVGSDLEELYETLKGFQGYSHWEEKPIINETEKKQAILAICASGEGTARRIKEMLEQSLGQQKDLLEVVTLSIAEMKQKIPKIQQQYHIMAATGVARPKLDVPFISLETFIEDGADKLIRELLLETEFKEDDPLALTEEKAWQTLQKFMEESVTFLNPKKMAAPLWRFALMLGREVGIEDYAFAINLAMHMAGVLERNLLNEPLSIEEDALAGLQKRPFYLIVERKVQELEQQVHTQVNLNEYYFILEMIDNQLESEEVYP